MNPRQNQISTVIHHQLQILRFLLLVPSDPLIAWGHLPSRRRPQQTGQYLLSTPPGAHQVAEICSYRHAVRQVVIPLDQLGPQPALAAALDHPQLQWCELPRASFQHGLWSARLAQSNAARSLRSRIPYRRQSQPALVAQAFQQPPAFLVLQSPVRSRPVQRSEEHTSELQSRFDLVCRLLLEKKKKNSSQNTITRNQRNRILFLSSPSLLTRTILLRAFCADHTTMVLSVSPPVSCPGSVYLSF